MRIRQLYNCINSVKTNLILQFTKKTFVNPWLNGILLSINANPFPIQIALLLLYRLSLDILYIQLISPKFAYLGFITDIDPYKFFFSWLIILMLSPLVADLLSKRTPSSILMSGLNLTYFVPLTSYCGCTGTAMFFLLVATAYWVLLLLFQRKIPVVQMRPVVQKHSKLIFELITIVATVVILYVSARYTGFRVVFDLTNVYGIRAESETYSMPSFLSYILSMMTMTLSIMILYWLKEKKYIVVLWLILIYLFYFSIAAVKSVFLVLFLVLGAYFFYRHWMIRWLPGTLTLFAWIALFEEKIFGNIYLMDYFFRRCLYVPTRISEYCFLFFSENPLNLFRHGIMSKLSFEQVYSTGIALLIGEYLGKPGMSANNGLLGDMWSNLPVYTGVVLMPLILVLCFRLLDFVSAKLETKYTVAFSAYYAYCFTNASWSVTLLTHGYLIACLWLLVFPREEHIL